MVGTARYDAEHLQKLLRVWSVDDWVDEYSLQSERVRGAVEKQLGKGESAHFLLIGEELGDLLGFSTLPQAEQERDLLIRVGEALREHNASAGQAFLDTLPSVFDGSATADAPLLAYADALQQQASASPEQIARVAETVGGRVNGARSTRLQYDLLGHLRESRLWDTDPHTDAEFRQRDLGKVTSIQLDPQRDIAKLIEAVGLLLAHRDDKGMTDQDRDTLSRYFESVNADIAAQHPQIAAFLQDRVSFPASLVGQGYASDPLLQLAVSLREHGSAVPPQVDEKANADAATSALGKTSKLVAPASGDVHNPADSLRFVGSPRLTTPAHPLRRTANTHTGYGL